MCDTASRPSFSRAAAGDCTRHLLIGNCGSDLAPLRQFLKAFQNVTVYDPHPAGSGHAFASFGCVDEARKAREALADGSFQQMGGRVLQLRFCLSSADAVGPRGG
jgi:hypothetical protein